MNADFHGQDRRRGGPDRRREGAERTRIVIVDDHALFRVGMRNILERETDFDVVGEADDSRSAVDVALETSPDVVLMDLSLPGLDGRETTKLLKAAPGTADVPVVILSGMPSEYARKSGADAFLTKPCEPSDLVEAIKRLLGQPSS